MNISQDALLNYCLLAVAVVGALAYALRVFRMVRKGEFTLGGGLTCMVLVGGFFLVCGLDLGGLSATAVFSAMFAVFTHVFIAQRFGFHRDASYKISIRILPFIGAVSLLALPRYWVYIGQWSFFIDVIIVFFILLSPSYFICTIKNKNVDFCKYILRIVFTSSAVSSLTALPILQFLVVIYMSNFPH